MKKRQTPNVTLITITIPRVLIKKYKNVIIFVNAIYINNLLFLYTISENLILRTTILLKLEPISSLASSLLNMTRLY